MLNLSILLVILNFCANSNVESGKIRKEERKMIKRATIVYQKEDLGLNPRIRTYNIPKATIKISM